MGGEMVEIETSSSHQGDFELRADEHGPTVRNSVHLGIEGRITLQWPSANRMWLSMHRRLQTEGPVTLLVNSTGQKPVSWSEQVKVKVHARSTLFATVDGRSISKLVFQETDADSWAAMTQDEPTVRIVMTAGPAWPNAGMAGTFEAHVALDKTVYNIRIDNGRDAACSFQVLAQPDPSVTVPDPNATGPPEAFVTGSDALAIMVDIVFVFIIFTVLAGFTFRRMASAGQLVVEEEEEDDYE